MGLKILIVDDDPTLRRMIAMILSYPDNGAVWQVYQAATGPKALEAVQQEKPDLVLTDVRMPGMTGYEVTRTIRSNPALYGDPAIVIMTAYGHMGETRIKAERAGADTYLPKPFEMPTEQIPGFLANIVAQRGSRDAKG